MDRWRSRFFSQIVSLHHSICTGAVQSLHAIFTLYCFFYLNHKHPRELSLPAEKQAADFSQITNMPLLDLPREILDSILEFVAFPDLPALSLTNKPLRTFVEPRLYSSIEMTWNQQHVPRIIPLLRTLMSRPELSGYVLRLHLSGKEHYYEPTPPNSNKISVSGLGLDEAIEFIHCTKVPYADPWMEELRAGIMPAIVALLLSFLPNLKTLHLEGHFTSDTRLYGKVFRSALCEDYGQGLPKFHDLREITFLAIGHAWRYSTLRKTADALSLFYLPAVERMSISIENPVQFSWPGHEPNPRFLTSLKLYRIRESRLGPLLSVCTNLKTLWWEWSYASDIDPKVSKPVIELDEIAAAISHVSSTLEALTIQAFGWMGGSEIEPPDVTAKGSWSFITKPEKLKRLEIPWAFLMGSSSYNLIPKSIESLTITSDLTECDDRDWDEYDMFYGVELWLRNWIAPIPRLRRVRALFKDLTYELELGTRKGLRQTLSKAGFEIEMIGLVKDIGRMYTPISEEVVSA